MAIINCPECGKEISDKAASCPNCGYVLNGGNKTSGTPIIAAGAVSSCPKCGSKNISYQREQTGSVGAGTNRVVIQQARKSHGCLYWFIIGWWWKPMYWLMFGWWWGLLFGGKSRRGLNFHANKALTRTTAVCQNCGYSWKA